jgi:Domain of unknown function (DUF4412)
MKQCIRVGLAVWFSFIFVFVWAGSSALAQAPQPFSADFSSTGADGMKKTGKWFFSPPKMRIDMTMPQGNGPFDGNVTMIIDGSTHISYMVMPQAKMFMEIQATGANDVQGLRNLESLSRGGDPCMGNPGSTCKKVGAETVNGRSCDKWEMTDKNSHKTVVWLDQKLYAVIRLREYDGTVTDLTNVKEGAQNASLFVVPPGYHKVDPSAMGNSK